ncbi:MAG: hypothetical protein U5K54_05645 [Cytophagales bacterium]|nr:hypothetical protein [Cytophagales bacterium]
MDSKGVRSKVILNGDFIADKKWVLDSGIEDAKRKEPLKMAICT